MANVYYPQPILALMAAGLHATPRAIGYVAMALQVGYALGILAFVPLGDIVQRRPLVVGLFAASAVCLGIAAFAPSVALLALAICAVGIATTAPQVLQPYAADLATPAQRGRVVGIIQTGLIVGTVYARASSGLIGAYVGWRAVFVVAAVLSAVGSLVLSRVMPATEQRTTMRYRDLIASMPPLIVNHALLRISMLLGFVSFSMFAGLWTILAFHVQDIGYGSDVVGYIGMVSIVGAFGAMSIGGMTDRFGTLFTGTIGWAMTTFAFVLFLIAGNSLPILFATMTIFALGVQVTQISNQARIFAISDSARSRLNTIYIFAMYSGAAYGSFVCAWVFQEAGWTGVCYLALAHMSVLALVLLWFRRVNMKTA